MSEPPASKKAKTDVYELIYWPGLPGRGEPIRLILEEAGATYSDSAKESKGVDKVVKHISPKFKDDDNIPPLAPPILRHGDLLISQLPVIANYLGNQLSLVPQDEKGKLQTQQLALTALDLQNETHDTHHPVAPSLYYEDQKEEALRKAEDFRKNRIPKFLGYFERVISQTGEGPYLLSTFTYADLILYFVVSGLLHAFPQAMERELKKVPKVKKHYETVKGRERIKAYEASERKQGFTDMGVYRHYAELDG